MILRKVTIIFLIFFSFLFLISNSYGYQFKNIKIQGSSKISKNTIKDIINYSTKKNYDDNDINNFQKKLFESGFFKNVNIKIENDLLVINVSENPLIDFYYIEGINDEKILDFLQAKLELNQNKIYSEAFLKSDILVIQDFFKSQGYLDIEVKPFLSELPNNLVNLVLRVNKKNKYRVNRIFFIGNINFKSSELISAITSTEHGWWKFLSNTTTLDYNRIDYDKFKLKKFYLDNGYYDVQVTSVSVDILKNYKSNITFSINSGELYNFNGYKIVDTNNNLSKDNKLYLEKLYSDVLKKNYSTIKLKKIKEITYNYLNSKKIEFVDLNINEEKNKNSIFVNLNFTNKNRQFVKTINVHGNSITEEKVIRDNLLIAEGDSYLDYKIEKSKRNLINTGIFKNVLTKIKKVENDVELVDLDINVEEQPTGSVSAGVGIGSNGSEVNTAIQEANLFGKGINLMSNISAGTEKISGNVKLVLPDFKNSGNDLIYNFYARKTKYDNAGYESKIVGNDIATKYFIYEDINLTVGLGVDKDSITTNNSANSLLKSRDGDYKTFKTFYAIKNDKRDRKYNTRSGHLLGFRQSLALPGSDITYLNNDIWSSAYYPVSENYILNFKTGFETINSLNNKDIKLSDRIYLSNKNLKGFENRGVGPIDLGDHVGGNYSAYANLSSTFPNPLPDNWNANTSVFFNAGNVWGVDYDGSKDSNKIRSSLGVSLDWISPLGPLSFTLSEVVSKASSDKDQNFSFQIGSAF